jgi:hypothetical protein
MKFLNRKQLLPSAFGLIVLIFIFLFEYSFGFEFSFPLFKIASILEIPGKIVINVILSVFFPMKAWQIMHGMLPFILYFLYFFTNFVFYFFFFSIILFILKKSMFKKIYNDI